MGKKKNRPMVKSGLKKVPKMDWSPSDKNISTLRRLGAVIDKENEYKNAA